MRIGPFAAALASLAIVTVARAEPVNDPLSAIAGRWQIVNAQTGEVTTPCAQGQLFVPTADRKYVDLSFGAAPDEPPLRYIVLQVQTDRLLMFIEGEERLTENGDPVVWWAVFDGADQFTWRRTDWPPQARTLATWRRCRAGDT